MQHVHLFNNQILSVYRQARQVMCAFAMRMVTRIGGISTVRIFLLVCFVDAYFMLRLGTALSHIFVLNLLLSDF